ncbi:MAG: peptide chain release factor 2 [Alcanivorax sp.]|nr:peptide chain release factor 2 [Alcanivorax sp.]
MEINPLRNQLADLKVRTDALRGYLDYPGKRERLTEVERELEDPAVWNTPDRAQALGRERAQLEAVVATLDQLEGSFEDSEAMLELAVGEQDEDMLGELAGELGQLEASVSNLEFRRMFAGEMDANSAYVDIQAGSGGTEAQDWAEMLLRMYLRWSDAHGFKTELVEASAGDVAGIKSATIHVQGDYAYGWLRTETGVHRLVRKSPFDSGGRRHTSFSSVFVSPEVDDDIDIDIDMGSVRVDTYRASGAGGQHVNRTDSAVRLTYVFKDPDTGEEHTVVTQCQSGRSQHQNKDTAIKMLQARVYELEVQKRNAEKQRLENTKSDIGWGSQIRSYVLDDARIKDLRTGVETRNTQAVLDGDLDRFIEASLKSGL